MARLQAGLESRNLQEGRSPSDTGKEDRLDVESEAL